MATKTQKIRIKGMHCKSCEKLIETTLKSIDGVEHIKTDYATETGEVKFDPEKTSLKKITKAIEQIGYECIDENTQSKSGSKQFWGLILGILGFFVFIFFAFTIYSRIPVPSLSANISYGLLFLIGLLTGFHCVSMCGGFVVSYSTKSPGWKSHVMYGAGKTISYTIIGAIFGLLGSIIVFTPLMRGVAGVVAGIFLVIFGINMLGIPFLRKIRLTTPGFINRFTAANSKNSPLVIGLLNGLMIACGPLQAIYIMAAGTGSVFEGAKLLFIFALGTLPVLLSFGFLTSFISNKMTHKILKLSGAVVIILGLIMVNRGLALTGAGFDFNSVVSSASSDVKTEPGSIIKMEGNYQVIHMNVTSKGWEPYKFVLKKGVPVKWIIDGQQLNGCNNAIVVPKLGLSFDIKPGEQVIEFTPTEEGTIPWSCWMGMIQGTFIVKEDTSDAQKELNSITPPASSGCGCGRR